MSAVERLLAISETRNLLNIDHDIACFEKLIHTILFYDEIYLVDDYIEYYRNRRKSTFSFIKTAQISDEDYRLASEEAASFAADQPFEMADGEPAGEALRFFEQLLLRPQLRWDIFVSSEYLTLTYLVGGFDEKNLVGPTIAAYGNEATDFGRMPNTQRAETVILDRSLVHRRSYQGETLSTFIKRIGHDNPNSKGVGHKDTLAKAVFAYGWIAERSRFYENIGRSLGLTPILSPLRDAYALSALRMQPWTLEDKLIYSANEISVRTITSAAQLTDCTALEFRQPFFSSWLMTKTDDPRAALGLALELRNQPEFSQARDQLANLAHLSFLEKKAEIANIIRSISDNNKSILDKYAVNTTNGPSLSFSIGLSGPSVGLSAGLGQLFRGLKSSRHPIARTYRSLAADLLAVERLGGIHEKLTCLLKAGKAGYPSFSTTPVFMRKKENEYGRPIE
ncbi:hypothetical protein NKI01_28120 [Mesorhizobium sp. M0815]|uniref:hypothetical protein n=1 Tax=Mesorhizobium sp. M0815 TaxID=2957005 RepID=UPI0033356FEC